MKLKVKDMDIATGGTLIVILNKKDTEEFDLHALDRIKVFKGKKMETAIVDIAESSKAVPRGKIGLFEEVLKSLRAKKGDCVKIMMAKKPWSLEYIKKKLDGGRLDKKEINQIVWDIVHNKLSQVELTYFVSACYSNHMNMTETTILTKAMADQGERLRPRKKPIMDKHCVGGVAGNRTTMVIVPIIAAAGLTMPKTSSRSITSPAGTADTMEVLANVSVNIKKMKKIVDKVGACIVWGGALNLAPADDQIIKVEKPLSIDAKSQLLASVMAKKYSVSATHVLIDIPYGKGSKIPTTKKANILKKDFEKIAHSLGMDTKVILTNGRQPIGNGIGPSLEAKDVLWLLKRDTRAPKDLENKSKKMASLLLKLSGKFKGKNTDKIVDELLESGKAHKKMIEIIKAQGAKITDPDKIKLGKFSYDYTASKKGKIIHISNATISKTARLAGAPKDNEAGIYLYKHVGDSVKKREKILTIYANSKEKLDYAVSILKRMNDIKIK